MTGWGIRTLYQTPGNDGSPGRRGRAMALVLGVALAALIGRWAWELGGPVAAVAAAAVYALDPNFLGHAALVKNDVGISLAYLAASYARGRPGGGWGGARRRGSPSPRRRRWALNSPACCWPR